MMHRKSVLLAGILIFTACQAENPGDNDPLMDPENDNQSVSELNNNENDDENSLENKDKEENNKVDEEEPGETITINIIDVEGEPGLISLEELSSALNGELKVEPIDRSAHLNIGNRLFYFVEEVPVMQVNGIHKPGEGLAFQIIEEEAYVSIDFIETGLDKNADVSESSVNIQWDQNAADSWVDSREDFHHDEMSVPDMIDYLSFLKSPIEQASVSTVESHLPGAPRNYRNGYHEGIDWYDYTTEVDINKDTPILAQSEGTVIRADHDFEEYPSHEVRNSDLEKAGEVGFTPQYIFDRLRGQQVWVQYADGVMIRFAHLNDIPEEIDVGMSVDEETIIGYVGNSGTSGALDGNNSGLHLHQDLLIYDRLFFEPYSLEETREIIHSLWGDGI